MMTQPTSYGDDSIYEMKIPNLHLFV